MSLLIIIKIYTVITYNNTLTILLKCHIVLVLLLNLIIKQLLLLKIKSIKKVQY